MTCPTSDTDSVFSEVCDYKEIRDSIAGKSYELVLCHYPIFSWKHMSRGTILLYGHTHNSPEDEYFQKCLAGMKDNDCRHIGDSPIRACNVGCMKTLDGLRTEKPAGDPKGILIKK